MLVGTLLVAKLYVLNHFYTVCDWYMRVLGCMRDWAGGGGGGGGGGAENDLNHRGC